MFFFRIGRVRKSIRTEQKATDDYQWNFLCLLKAPFLPVAVGSPRLLSETIIEIVSDIRSRLPPGFFLHHITYTVGKHKISVLRIRDILAWFRIRTSD